MDILTDLEYVHFNRNFSTTYFYLNLIGNQINSNENACTFAFAKL